VLAGRISGLVPAGKRDQWLLFAVMLTLSIGNTGLQSVLPALGRSLHMPDWTVAVAFSFSAFIWSISAPIWARRLARYGAKRMVLTGLGGFMISLILCGMSLSAGVLGFVGGGLAFAGFMLGRSMYGAFGSAASPAAQALIVAGASRADRTRALALLASAFGLGTILGPALAPFLILPRIGLAGPPFLFALLGLPLLAAVLLLLRDSSAAARESVLPAAELELGAEPSDLELPFDGSGAEVSLLDPRVRRWFMIGLVSGHAQAIANQVMAFLLIDRLRATPLAAQPVVGTVLMAGAVASLLAQWGFIPRLDMRPRQLIVWGALLVAVGCTGIAVSHDQHAIMFAFAVASLGFGFLRPGFTAGASLAVGDHEQGSIAGKVTAVNGIVFVAGPSVGVLMYAAWQPLPYLAVAAAMLMVIAFTLLMRRTRR
jgi:MFS family permease